MNKTALPLVFSDIMTLFHVLDIIDCAVVSVFILIDFRFVLLSSIRSIFHFKDSLYHQKSSPIPFYKVRICKVRICACRGGGEFISCGGGKNLFLWIIVDHVRKYER